MAYVQNALQKGQAIDVVRQADGWGRRQTRGEIRRIVKVKGNLIETVAHLQSGKSERGSVPLNIV